MARHRFENLDPDRRERILSAAGHEFAERGYAAASLGRIIESAEISKGLLYYYFNDKQDLFTTAVEAAVEQVFAALGGVPLDELTAETYWDALRDMGLKTITILGPDAWYSRLVMAFPRLRQEPEAREAVRPALEAGRQLTARLLERGQALGTVRTDLPLDLLVATLMAADDAGGRWMLAHRDQFDDEAFRKLVEGRIDLMRDMLDAQHEGWDR